MTVTESNSPVGRWTELLDGLDAELTSLELQLADPTLADGPGPAAPWSPPADLAPLPDEMVERATQVIRRMLAVESRLVARRERVRDTLAFASARRARTQRADSRAGLDVLG